MFGKGMMEKLQAMKQETEVIKARLDNITVSGEAESGKIKIEITGNRKVKSIHIDESLLANKEELEELTLIAINRAIEQAEHVNETEMRGAAMSMMPNLK